jgi:hypothetical protein
MNDSARSADYKRGQAGWQSGWKIDSPLTATLSLQKDSFSLKKLLDP